MKIIEVKEGKIPGTQKIEGVDYSVAGDMKPIFDRKIEVIPDQIRKEISERRKAKQLAQLQKWYNERKQFMVNQYREEKEKEAAELQNAKQYYINQYLKEKGDNQ